MYNLKEIAEKDMWNNFVTAHFSFYSFLSSWEWGEFNVSLGHDVFRLGVYNEDKLIGVIQMIKHEAKRGTYLLCPHSPLLVGDYFSILSSIKPTIKQFAQKHGARFVRINGVTKNTVDNLLSYKKMGFVFAPMHAHAEETNLLDLGPSEDELLANMRKTTRYIINRAYKEGVTVEKDNSSESVERFISLHHKHARRTDGKLQYTPFSAEYIRGLFTMFSKDQISCFNAYYEGVLEASVVSIVFGETAVYYLGVSDIKHPKFSPSYVCQRESIKYARSQGASSYNFWGVCPDDNKKHPLYGPSLFKRGFGGEDFFLTHAQDLVCSPLYWITYGIEMLRRWKRGYYYVQPKD